MMNGISGASSYFGQMQSMGQKQGAGDKFAQLDADSSGSIDSSELQTLTDKIAQKTGLDMDVEEVSAAYDTNNDGLLSQDETKAMMMEMRQKMGMKGQGNMGGMGNMQSLSAYETETEDDLAKTLMDMLSEQGKNRATYTPFNVEV